MRFAYADPPYLGCGKLYSAHHPDALDFDDPETHRRLISRLGDEFPDGWALSASEPSLRVFLQMCPSDVRVASWVKPFASFKPGVGVAYTWEPVLFRGGRKVSRDQPTRRDWLAESITLRKGLTGAKPPRFCRWIFSLLNADADDDLVDLFPGTGIVGATWKSWLALDCPVEIGGNKKADKASKPISRAEN
jgi:hypothetical protein